MNESQRLRMPFILPGQSQKELFHNEALQMLDAVVASCVESGPSDQPPAQPTVGQSFLVGPAPSGAWSGQAGALALLTEAGWRFVLPVEGMQAMIRTSGTWAIFRSGGWELGAVRGDRVMIAGKQVVGPRSAAVPDAAGGATVDMDARRAINGLLAALRAHGLISTE